MKIQSHNLIFFERTQNGWMDGHLMDGKRDKPKAICTFNFIKVRPIENLRS